MTPYQLITLVRQAAAQAPRAPGPASALPAAQQQPHQQFDTWDVAELSSWLG